MNSEYFQKKSMAEIKLILKDSSIDEKLKFVPIFLSDKRKNLNLFGEKILKEKAKVDKEICRTKSMYSFEKKLYNDYSYIAGIDEVGRGPLAGDVVTACVILPRNKNILNLNDSKKINEKNREKLYEEICEKAISISIGISTNIEIDKYNILNATKLAMKRAIENSEIKPDILLIDAVKLDDVSTPQHSIIKGDEKIASIAAASIVAKVIRDRMMVELSNKYPYYDFENNKGYGTRRHYDGLNRYGYSKIHRKTFIKEYI